MEIIKRSKGNVGYRESFYLNGKKIHGPVFDRKTDAKAWKARLETERDLKKSRGENFYVATDKTFKEYAELWLLEVKQNSSPKTYASYSSICTFHLLPVFGKLKLSEINEDHGKKFLQKIRETNNPKGVSNVWSVLRNILRKAKKDKLIPFLPFEDLVLPKSELSVDKFWVKSEIDQFLKANIKNDLYPLFILAIDTGMRLAELCGLCWDRVDFSRNQITITRTRDKYGLRETTKTKLKRIVPMTNEVRLLLLELFKRGNNPRFVLTEPNGEPIKYAHIYRRFKMAQKKAGILNIIRFHDLRHTFASNFMMNNGNLFDLQKLLGHTKNDMTMRYAHLSPDHLQDSVKFMTISGEKSLNRPDLDHNRVESLENVLMMSC